MTEINKPSTPMMIPAMFWGFEIGLLPFEVDIDPQAWMLAPLPF
jgi:hypothetical protein